MPASELIQKKSLALQMLEQGNLILPVISFIKFSNDFSKGFNDHFCPVNNMYIITCNLYRQ